MTVLVVAAHPDDEVLGCGATAARLAAQGRSVHVLILGEGHTSRLDDRTTADADSLAGLVSSSQEAARRLGVAEPVHAGLPDNRFDQVDLLDIVKVVEEQVEAIRPTLVLGHHGGDLNVDHRLAAQATLTAARPQPGSSVATLLAFEVASASEWGFGVAGPPFAPSVFVDVTDTIDQKLDALRAYEDELRPFPHARSLESVAAAATRRGTAVGVTAAEAFELVFARR